LKFLLIALNELLELEIELVKLELNVIKLLLLSPFKFGKEDDIVVLIVVLLLKLPSP
jgi:hypothetical protein